MIVYHHATHVMTSGIVVKLKCLCLEIVSEWRAILIAKLASRNSLNHVGRTANPLAVGTNVGIFHVGNTFLERSISLCEGIIIESQRNPSIVVAVVNKVHYVAHITE